jgi:uncharacterized protein (TIGR03000 family)
MKAARTTLGVVLLVMAASAAPLIGDEKGAKKEELNGRAKLVLKVVEDARLWVDDEEMKDTGETRTYYTPATLKKGKRYYYIVKAVWEPNNYTTITRTRKVIVESDKVTEFDLTKADPKQPDKIVIRYVPTPQVFVNKMMELAKVTDKDVVFDLGCGDGRLVITAVKKYKAKHAVGVDIDPQRIREANANAKEAGKAVAECVEFRVQDVMKVPDLEKATVVTLYLADELNEQLRPILQKRLPNGARIVSHRFLMGDWKPEKSVEVTDEDEGYKEKIHLWTIKKPVKKKDDKKDGKKDDKKDK